MLVRGIHAEAGHYKEVECVGFRPGIIDTRQQELLRNQTKEVLPMVHFYKEFFEKGMLKKPSYVAEILYTHLLASEIEAGKIYAIEEFNGK